MAYRHVTERENYADLSSGAVLRSAPGFPAFPVRLASEVFLRASALRGNDAPATVWDPCCGSGHLLAVLGLLHRRTLASILATDIAESVLTLAEENLALLDPDALDRRAGELDARAERLGKPGYLESAEAARRLAAGLVRDGGALPAAVRRANAFDPDELGRAVAGPLPDIVVTDVPYGEQTGWLGTAGESGVAEMLAAVASVLPPEAVVAVTVRGRRVPPAAARPEEKFRIGTRAVALFRAGRLA